MSTVQFVFSTSFDEQTCDEFTKSTKKKSRHACTKCGLSKSQHLLAIACDADEEEADSFMLLAQVFCDLRNLRLCITNFFGWSAVEVNDMLPRLITMLTDSLFAMEEITDIVDIEQLIEAGQELVGYFEPSSDGDNLIEYDSQQHVNSLEMSTSLLTDSVFSLCCRFISALDDVYYRLYYSASLTWRSTSDPTDSCPIPMPHEYFSKYLIDEDTINRRLGKVFDNNFTPEYKAHISRVFGMAESMASNPLLSLHFSRWREGICLLHTLPGLVHSSLPLLLQACVMPSLGEDPDADVAPPHATMKQPGDPLLPPLLRVWNDSCRTWACHLYAYATPSPEALDALASHAPLVEIGAGG